MTRSQSFLMKNKNTGEIILNESKQKLSCAQWKSKKKYVLLKSICFISFLLYIVY